MYTSNKNDYRFDPIKVEVERHPTRRQNASHITHPKVSGISGIKYSH